MIQLPLITSRSASKSVYQRQSAHQPKQQSLVERFQMVTKVTNYEGMSEQQIWKQYQKLRQCLKILNQSVLEQIQKKQVALRKQSPKKRTSNQTLNVIEEEIKTVQQAIKLSSIQLTSAQNKLGYVSKLNVREMEADYEKLKIKLKKLRLDIKSMSTQTFMLSKNLTKGPSALEKLSQSTSQLQFLQRKVYKQSNRLAQTEEILATCVSKLSQLTRTQSQRQDQYQLFQQQKKQQDNILHYQQLTTTKNDMEKYESPWKKNYLLKLKQLDNLVGSIEEGDNKIKQVQLSILKVKNLIDSADSKTVVMRRQLKKQDMNKFNHSTMEMRDSQPKTESQKTNEDKCF